VTRAWLVGIPLAAFLWLGCQGETTGVTASDFQKQREALVAKQKRRAEKTGEPAPAEGLSDLGHSEIFSYDRADKRDPFRSFILDRLKEEQEGDRGPLEQFELSQLSVVAVVWGTNNRRALVEDPSGRGYVVQEGTPIGKNEGQVIRIDDNAVVVRETYVDYLGARTTKEIEMSVHQASGG
jgi:type IV pilus assembly protein PilP